MNIFIGGSYDGQNFFFKPGEYQSNTFQMTDIKTEKKSVYNRYEAGEQTFWVDETLSEDDVNLRIKNLLDK